MLGLKRNKQQSRPDIESVLGDFELPTIPAVVSAAIEKVLSPGCDMDELSEVISTDPGLSARLLTMVNSAAAAPRNPIVGVNQAVKMLGRNHLESLFISLAASGAAASAEVPGFDMDRFWLDSAWRGTTAATFAGRFDPARRTENFTAALLKEIAVPILVSCQPPYAELLREWETGDTPLADLEEMTFGWTHTEVAGWMFDKWGFPTSLREAVTEIGEPEDTELTYPFVQILTALKSSDVDEESHDIVERVATRIENLFPVEFDDAMSVIENAREDAGQVARSLQ